MSTTSTCTCGSSSPQSNSQAAEDKFYVLYRDTGEFQINPWHETQEYLGSWSTLQEAQLELSTLVALQQKDLFYCDYEFKGPCWAARDGMLTAEFENQRLSRTIEFYIESTGAGTELQGQRVWLLEHKTKGTLGVFRSRVGAQAVKSTLDSVGDGEGTSVREVTMQV